MLYAEDNNKNKTTYKPAPTPIRRNPRGLAGLPGTRATIELQRSANESSRAQRMQVIQRMADESSRVQSLQALQRKADESSRVRELDELQRKADEKTGYQTSTIAVQPKLTVSNPGDPAEIEADKAAEQVMSNRPFDPNMLHRKPSSTATTTVNNSTANQINNISGGSPLSSTQKSYFEPRFGADFSNVRVHTNSQAAGMATAVNAKAFTKGNDIVFAKGQYQPGTESGDKLIAHELAHVVQRGSDVRRYTYKQRHPKKNHTTFDIVYGDNFLLAGNGFTLNQTLFNKVYNLCEYLIDNDLVYDDIKLNQGVRLRTVAHKWSTAYNIRKNRIPLSRLRNLPSGKDKDGNLWYKHGWSMQQIKANARSIWPGAEAAEGYPRGSLYRLPNTNRPNISKHIWGNAIDVSIPWKIGPWSNKAKRLVRKFGLKRPIYPREPWHFQLL